MKSAPSKSQLPHGFRFAAAACGIRKSGGLDLALIESEVPASAAAVFTTNLVQAAPVKVSRKHVRKSARGMRAIIVNAGNANCCTGRAGMEATRTTAKRVADEIGCRSEQVIVCSTGVIGVPMDAARILRVVPALVASRTAKSSAFSSVTRAIMTTDTRPKWAAAQVKLDSRTARVLGCAKGAGMIHPNMATMLAFVSTDADIAPPLLRRAVREVVARTFNRITVDGDTSTNDTLAVLANGASGAKVAGAGAYARFVAALEEVCHSLSLAIVADGEGAKRVVEVLVRGTRDAQSADCVARTIAHSPLVKTALAGADPNWGRILAAAGRSGVKFNPDRARISLAGKRVFRDGKPLPFDERAAHRKLLAKYIPIVVDLRCGSGAARVWTCDFTADYVQINASYRT